MTHQTVSRTPVVDRQPRCWNCNKKLANYLARPWDIDCVRCKAKNGRELASASREE